MQLSISGAKDGLYSPSVATIACFCFIARPVMPRSLGNFTIIGFSILVEDAFFIAPLEFFLSTLLLTMSFVSYSSVEILYKLSSKRSVISRAHFSNPKSLGNLDSNDSLSFACSF